MKTGEIFDKLHKHIKDLEAEVKSLKVELSKSNEEVQRSGYELGYDVGYEDARKEYDSCECY